MRLNGVDNTLCFYAVFQDAKVQVNSLHQQRLNGKHLKGPSPAQAKQSSAQMLRLRVRDDLYRSAVISDLSWMMDHQPIPVENPSFVTRGACDCNSNVAQSVRPGYE